MNEFETLLSELKEIVRLDDRESAHEMGDAILEKIALNTGLTKNEREQLISVYRQILKWYA